MAVIASAGILLHSAESFAQSSTDTNMTTARITAPPGLVLTATSSNGISQSSVNLGTPTLIGNPTPAPVITNNAPDIFPIGVTTIVWTATDTAGNTASAAQRVIVEDRVAPTITAPPSYALNADTETVILHQDQTGFAIASDNIDDTPLITSDVDERRSIGNSTVSWTVTDTAGNTATAIQKIIIKNEEPIKQSTTVLHDTFDNNTDPWRNWGAPLHTFSSHDCVRTDTNRHSLVHSSVNNGSAYFDFNGACGVGYIGMQRYFQLDAPTDNHDLEFSFDYLHTADTADFRVYLIGDGSPFTPSYQTYVWETTQEPTVGTEFNTFTARVPLIDFSECHCRLLIFGWAQSPDNSTFHIDNVKVVTIPVSGGGSSASGAIDTYTNDLSTVEILDMLHDGNPNTVLFTSKQYSSLDGTITVSWEAGDATQLEPYKIVIAPVSNPADKTTDIVDAGIHNYTFENLKDDTAYFVSVGVRGDDNTQSTILVNTGDEPFDSNLALKASHIAGSDTISIEWSDSNEVGDDTYRMQRLDGENIVEQFSAGNGTVSDTIRPEWLGQDISYRIFERVGQHKIYSDIVTISMPSALESPDNFGVRAIDTAASSTSDNDITRIHLGWDHVPLFRNYLVETYSAADNSWSKIEKTKQNSIVYDMPAVEQTITIPFRITVQMGSAAPTEPVEIRHTIWLDSQAN